MHRFVFLPQLFSGGVNWTLTSGSGSVGSGTVSSLLTGTGGADTLNIRGAGSFMYANGGGSVDTFIWTNGSSSGTVSVGDEFGTAVTVGYNYGGVSGVSFLNESVSLTERTFRYPESVYSYGSTNDEIGQYLGEATHDVTIYADGGRDIVYLNGSTYNGFYVDMGDAELYLPLLQPLLVRVEVPHVRI